MSAPTTPTFPLHFGAPSDSEGDVSRRTFLKLLSATVLASSAAACAEPTGEIVPYVFQPPEVVPGVPLHFATAMELDGYATGLLVESREGRPVKVEGNPSHPASLGASGAFHQAAVLQLYDPDRPQFVGHRRTPTVWPNCAAAFSRDELHRVAGANGDGLFFLLEPSASPIVQDLIRRVQERFPAAAFHFYAPLCTTFAADGTSLAFGDRTQPIFDFTKADVIVTADCDLLTEGPFHLRYARQFADRRRVRAAGDTMNRLYAIEGAFTPTGITADHRFAVRPGDIGATIAALTREVLLADNAASNGSDVLRSALDPLASSVAGTWIHAVARDLISHRGRAVVAIGTRQPAWVHALGAALNDALGATGTVVSYADPLLPHGPGLPELAAAARAQQVKALVIIGGNPAYNAPADVEFPALLGGIPRSFYAGSHENESAAVAEWFVPLAHFLESWGDARALDGTTSIVQPLVAPLHGARSVVELLAFFAGDDRPPDVVVRDFWLEAGRFGGDIDGWRDALRKGIVPRPASASRSQPVRWPAVAAAIRKEPPAAARPLELAFVPDPSVHDGRFANNGWLQELPDPVTKLTWDNAAYMSRSTLDAMGAKESELIEIAANGRRLRAPAFVAPGVADGLVVLPFGYGRTGAEQVARGVGVNAYALWTAGQFATGAAAAPAVILGVHGWHEFAVTSPHWSLDGRPIVLNADLDRFAANPHVAAEHNGPVAALYGVSPAAPRQWGMAIDLTVCTGCSACMVACQAENNVPVVGKSNVQQRHEMHWLRIDRYLSGGDDGSRIDVQPMLCQHCESAPCEYVCPVNATVHSPDGLNEMVYNRCVGTRFCSNNCPYKVRRFNFLNYTQELPETEQMAMNPDVTVRARGVMEKCTFCVQRIRRADIDADLTGTAAPYAQLQTACQQACPTRAIVFGSIADPDAAVTHDAAAPHSYHVLNELGTRPRISYLARLRNPNRALAGDQA